MAQKCTALLGHELKTTQRIWNYCLGSTAAAFLLLGIFFGFIFFLSPTDFYSATGSDGNRLIILATRLLANFLHPALFIQILRQISLHNPGLP